MLHSFDPFPTLTNSRLTLRKTSHSDCPVIFELRSDPELNKYIERQVPKSIDDAVAFYQRINKEIEFGLSISWAITVESNANMIGSICLWNFSGDGKTAEVGYALLYQYHNQRIMSEAIALVTSYGFDSLKLNKVEAYTQHRNQASKKTLINNGFIHNKVRKDKDCPDNWIYELHKPR